MDPVSIVIATIRDLSADGALPSELTLAALDSATTLDALGLDSMARLELLAELEERVDCHIPESFMSGIRTIADLAATLVVARKAA